MGSGLDTTSDFVDSAAGFDPADRRSTKRRSHCAGRLAFTQAVLINLGINRPDLSNTAITYFYDEDVIFSRVTCLICSIEKKPPPGCGTIPAESIFQTSTGLFGKQRPNRTGHIGSPSVRLHTRQ